MNDENEEMIVHKLESIFANVNAWLNFAEIKNAALLVFNFTVLGFLFESKVFAQWFITINGSILLMSVLLVLVSFIPNVGLKIFNFLKVIRLIKKPESSNLLYYEAISFYDKNTYLKEIREKYYNINTVTTQGNDYLEQQKEYVEEIIINSKITTVKYCLFKNATILSILVVLLLLVSILTG